MSDTVVHLDGISKRFGRAVALHPLDIRIERGEFVTFLGPSGCGKSTTLRILGGFERPDTGRVILGGADVTGLPPNRRNVNMVFQDYALFPHMTVAENVAFGLELKRRSRTEIGVRVAEVLALLELEALTDRFPDQISGGQRQRAALARALAPDPDLLLLDEPLGALDAQLRAQVQVELKEIQRRTGKTFFFVTHDQDEALTMSDRIVVMNAGRIEQDGSPEDLYLRPESRFVATFVGEANLLEAYVLRTDGSEVVVDWQGLTLYGRMVGRPSPGTQVGAAVRLERMSLSPGRPDQANAVEGRVTARIFKGSRTLVELQVGAHRLRTYVGDTALAAGDTAWLAWQSEDMAVFET
ncbi:MAG: ABC transporter ATP-binding protein [Pseudomonadota bacterium]